MIIKKDHTHLYLVLMTVVSHILLIQLMMMHMKALNHSVLELMLSLVINIIVLDVALLTKQRLI